MTSCWYSSSVGLTEETRTRRGASRSRDTLCSRHRFRGTEPAPFYCSELDNFCAFFPPRLHIEPLLSPASQCHKARHGLIRAWKPSYGPPLITWFYHNMHAKPSLTRTRNTDTVVLLLFLFCSKWDTVRKQISSTVWTVLTVILPI